MYRRLRGLPYTSAHETGDVWTSETGRGGLFVNPSSHFKCRVLLAAATVLLTLATGASGASTRSWPSLLGSREAFPPDVSAAVERVWIEPTLSRTVHGRSARVPFGVYVAFVDTPEVTAAAARFRKLGSYEIQALDDDRYRANDGDGARGLAQVLRREPRRRVILSRGEHTGPILGTISGSALTVLDLEPRGDAVNPRLTTYVYIDGRVAAALARVLIASFGFIADRKLGEGFASRRKSPSGRSTGLAASVSGSHASRFRPCDAIAFWPSSHRAKQA